MSEISRELITHDISEIIQKEHHLTDDQIPFDSVNSALINITKFFLEPINNSKTIPYQYQKDNQSIFNQNQIIISNALNNIKPYLHKESHNLIKSWEMVVEWQSEIMNNIDKFDRVSFDDYLTTHIILFRKDVEPNLMRVYSWGLQEILQKEKELALQFTLEQTKEMVDLRKKEKLKK